MVLPLDGIRVLDLSTLLPGPLASLMLAEAGAQVIKVERPGSGDEMRTYSPRLGAASANYALLNRGKSAYAADLKDPAARDRVLRLAARADVVIEQFRPGVVDRLGLGFETVRAANPRVIYCSITGYGPTGRHAMRAGHDLNYLADSGLLGTVTDGGGSPTLPVSVIADIVGGTYPAVVNILLALRKRDLSGQPSHIQVAMTSNLQVLAYGYLATHQAGGGWPTPSGELLTGGSPRYQIYSTADRRHVACAALEQRFWERLLELLGVESAWTNEAGREAEAIKVVAERFASQPSDHWRNVLEGEDVCTVVVSTWDEAVAQGFVSVDHDDLVSTPHGDLSVAGLPSPISDSLRRAPTTLPYPALVDLPDNPQWPTEMTRGLEVGR